MSKEDLTNLRDKIFSSAQKTLREYSNNRIKELGLVTRGYKFDFPYDDVHSVRDSNHRLAIILEKNLFQKVPHLAASNCKFWSKSRTYITLLLENTPKSKRYVTRLLKKIRLSGFPMNMIQGPVGNSFFSEVTGTYHEQLKLTINLNETLWGKYGITKLIYHYNDIEQMMINLQRVGFYEPLNNGQAQENQAQANQGQGAQAIQASGNSIGTSGGGASNTQR